METFEYYVKQGKVKKQTPNIERAKSLIKDAKSRINDLKLLDLKKFPKLVFEHTYDALRDFCDAILILDGYKSYSHEASVVYLLKKGFNIVEVSQLDKFRFKRNGSKYYGQKISEKEAVNIVSFYKEQKLKFSKLFGGIN